MQEMAINWTLFRLTLAGAFVFGILFSMLVRWASRKHIVGQTAWSVVVGVTVTLIFMIPVFGLDRIAYAFVYFSASGLPMIVEYILRVQDELQADHKKAQDIAKDLLTK